MKPGVALQASLPLSRGETAAKTEVAKRRPRQLRGQGGEESRLLSEFKMLGERAPLGLGKFGELWGTTPKRGQNATWGTLGNSGIVQGRIKTLIIRSRRPFQLFRTPF